MGDAIGPLKQSYVALVRIELPYPLPSSPKSLKPRAVEASKVVGRRRVKKARKVLNMI